MSDSLAVAIGYHVALENGCGQLRVPAFPGRRVGKTVTEASSNLLSRKLQSWQARRVGFCRRLRLKLFKDCRDAGTHPGGTVFQTLLQRECRAFRGFGLN